MIRHCYRMAVGKLGRRATGSLGGQLRCRSTAPGAGKVRTGHAHYVEALRLGSEGSRYMTAWLDDPSDVSARDLGVQDFRQSKQEIDLAEQEFLALAPQK